MYLVELKTLYKIQNNYSGENYIYMNSNLLYYTFILIQFHIILGLRIYYYYISHLCLL